VPRGGPNAPSNSAPGEAVQVDPMNAKLKLPGTQRLKLECDELLKETALNFKLRRYNLDRAGEQPQRVWVKPEGERCLRWEAQARGT